MDIQSVSFLWFPLGCQWPYALGDFILSDVAFDLFSAYNLSSLGARLVYLFLSVAVNSAVNSVSGAHRAPSPRKLYKNSPRLSDGEQNTENLQLSLRPNAALSPPTQILFNLFCLMKALAVKNRCGFFFSLLESSCVTRLLVSTVQRSESAPCTDTHPLLWTRSPLGSSQSRAARAAQ